MADTTVWGLIKAGKWSRRAFFELNQDRRRRKGLPTKKWEDRKMKLSDLRTSTKAGGAGLVPLLGAGLSLLPFYDEINGYLVQACQSDQGPTMFLVGGGIIWVTMFVSARLSKTPANPGKL